MIEVVRKLVRDLTESEAKSILQHFLLKIHFSVQNGDSLEDTANEWVKMYNDLIKNAADQTKDKEEKPCKKVHIVFGPSTMGSLRIALKKMGLEKQERIIMFEDLFSIGPVWHLHEKPGRKKRQEWLLHNINYEDDYFEKEYIAHFENTLQLINHLPDNIPITIWCGDNAHEQTGFRFIMYVLRDKTNDIKIIDAAHEYQEFTGQSSYRMVFLHTGEISAKDLGKILQNKKTRVPLSPQERDRLEKEWLHLSAQKNLLRIWKDGNIESVNENYFDECIVRTVQKLHKLEKHKEFFNAANVIGEVISDAGEYIGDTFVEYRIRQLIYDGVLDIKGIPRAMRYYSVKLKSNTDNLVGR